MSRSEERPGVVLDTMVIFQATASPAGPAAELLRRLEAGWFTPYISAEILDEVRDVLSRPKIRAKYPRITDESVEALLNRLTRSARMISTIPDAFSLPRDPDDEPYLNLAFFQTPTRLLSRGRSAKRGSRAAFILGSAVCGTPGGFVKSLLVYRFGGSDDRDG